MESELHHIALISHPVKSLYYTEMEITNFKIKTNAND